MDLLRFVPAVDVALYLLIALEIIKKNKEEAMFFPTDTSTFVDLRETSACWFPELARVHNELSQTVPCFLQ